jgi:PAS domain S-box-containing protein
MSEMKRFPLLRYFTIASFIAIAAVTVALAVLLTKETEGNFIDRNEQQGIVEADHVLRMFYSDVLAPQLDDNPHVAIGDAVEAQMMDEFVDRSPGGVNVKEISIFDPEGNLVDSTNPSAGGITGSERELFRRAVQGTPSSNLATGTEITGADGASHDLDVVRSYVAIRETAPDSGQDGAVLGVLSISQDVTDALATARADALRNSVIASMAAGGVLFLILLLIVFRADWVIAAQRGGLEREISDRKQAERALRESEETVRALLNAPPDTALLIDTEGTILALNDAATRRLGEVAAERFGERPDGLVGLSVFDLFPPGLAQSRRSRNDDAVRSGKCARFEDERDGKWFDNTIYPIQDAQGTVVRLAIFSRDITDHKQAEEALAQRSQELARSNAELEEFTYTVSHDLKEPLRGIEAFSGFLAEDYGDKLDEEGQRYVDILRESAVRMKNLIEDLLQLSRVGRAQDSHVSVGAGSLLEDIRRDMDFALQEKKVDLRIQPDLPTVTCQPVQIKEMFKNLISNAVKFNDKSQPVVDITCRQDDGVYTFSVRDNGIGIDEKHQERIFRAFQRLNRREDYEGTGIGLAICKKVAEGHGGRIWVESKVGEGSTFSFTIPKTDARIEQDEGRRDGNGT